MTVKNSFLEKGRGPIIISCILLLICSGIIGYLVLDFNNNENEVTGASENSKISFITDIGAEKEERWDSTMLTVDSPEEMVLFTGETVNAAVINNNKFDIKQWSLKVSPKNECYLNGFWGGSIEVHQFRDGKEIVETIDKNVSASEIKQLEVNPYLDVMMIRFLPGDYFIYKTSAQGEAEAIKAGATIGIVLNMYYAEPLDFSEYSFVYCNDIKISETWIHPLILSLWGIWFVIFVIFITTNVANKRLVHDLKNSVQSIQAMADLYLETYIVDLDKQDAYLIKGQTEQSLIKFTKGELQDSLYQYVSEDCMDAYVEDIRSFLDLSTIDERMKENSSVVFEYKSKSLGWCSIRIFKMNHKKEVAKLVLAIQDINEERRKLHAIEDHIRQKENDVTIQADFMENTFYAMNTIASAIRATSGELAEELTDEKQKMMALSINDSIEHLHLLKNCIYDLFNMNTERFAIRSEVYNLREMVEKLKRILTPFYMGKEYEFQIEIDQEIPELLKGDKERLMQILVILLFSSMFVTEKGFVKLSVFGKQTDNKVELVFSVRDSAIGFTEEQVQEIQQVFREAKLKPVDNAALVYLQIMDQILRKMKSEMKVVSVYGSGSEFYFSLEQETVNE